MGYSIFFFLEFLLVAIGAVSGYTYVEIKEEHNHSENAKQITLVNLILCSSIFFITSLLYIYNKITSDRLTIIILVSCIITTGIGFAIYYLLQREYDDYTDNTNKELKEIQEITYIISVFLLIFSIGVILGSGSTPVEKISITKITDNPILTKLRTKTPPPKYKAIPVTKSSINTTDDLMDDFIGKDETIQKVIIL